VRSKKSSRRQAKKAAKAHTQNVQAEGRHRRTFSKPQQQQQQQQQTKETRRAEQAQAPQSQQHSRNLLQQQLHLSQEYPRLQRKQPLTTTATSGGAQAPAAARDGGDLQDEDACSDVSDVASPLHEKGMAVGGPPEVRDRSGLDELAESRKVRARHGIVRRRWGNFFLAPASPHLFSAAPPQPADLRARHWHFMFDNLRRAVDQLYGTCEVDESRIECEEIILVLEQARVSSGPPQHEALFFFA
jgi:hypothetical protein